MLSMLLQNPDATSAPYFFGMMGAAFALVFASAPNRPSFSLLRAPGAVPRLGPAGLGLDRVGGVADIGAAYGTAKSGVGQGAVFFLGSSSGALGPGLGASLCRYGVATSVVCAGEGAGGRGHGAVSSAKLAREPFALWHPHPARPSLRRLGRTALARTRMGPTTSEQIFN